MQSSSSLLLLAMFAFTGLTGADKSCKEFISDTTAKTMKSFFECKKTMVFKDEEDKLSKMNCILACTLKKEKFLSDDGFVDEASILAFVENEIPKSVQDKAVSLMLGCQEFGAKIDPTEEKCTSYNALIKCALSVMFKVCN